MIGAFKTEQQKLHKIPASDMIYLSCRYFMRANEIVPIAITQLFKQTGV